jgi:hypothetical protein
VVERGKHDAAHATTDEVLDDLDLLFAVILLERTLPDHVHRDALRGELALGLHGAGVDGLPELVRRALRDDGDGVGFGGRQRGSAAKAKQGEPGGLHERGGLMRTEERETMTTDGRACVNPAPILTVNLTNQPGPAGAPAG